MVAAAVAAPVVALRAPVEELEEARDRLPIHAGDRLVGSYYCTQGHTELAFVVEDTKSAGYDGVFVEVTFEFQFDGTSIGKPSAQGAAKMTGLLDPKTKKLRLHGEDWIEQPSGYRLVDFVGTFGRGGVFSGRVDGPGCTTFTASPERSDAAP